MEPKDILERAERPLNIHLLSRFETEEKILKFIMGEPNNLYKYYLYRLEKWKKIYLTGMFEQWKQHPSFFFLENIQDHRLKILSAPIDLIGDNRILSDELYFFLPHVQTWFLPGLKSTQNFTIIQNDLYKYLITEEALPTYKVLIIIDYTIYQNFISQG